jgi:hypothetical protein
MRQVPTTADAVLYSQVTALDGSDFVLTFALNLRDGRWYLDIADQDSVAIAVNIPLTVNFDLLNRVIDPRRPPGKLVCIDPTGADQDPGPGTAPTLFYVEASESA